MPLLLKFQISIPEGVYFVVRFLKEPPFRYFIQRSLLTRCFLSAYNCQMIFPPKSKFARPGSLIYNPPSWNGLVRISHLNRCNLLYFPLPPFHRKSRRSLEICFVIDLGASRMEDWKMGRAERTAFIKTIFPSFVSQWPPQDTIFAFILLMTSSQREGRLGSKVKGMPRYLIFPQLSYLENPKEQAIRRIDRWSTFQS